MRFAPLFALLLLISQLSAQPVSDSTLMNSGVLSPRSRVIVYDAQDCVMPSKYVATVAQWVNSADNPRSFETTFTRPFSWLGRQLILRVERASSPYSIAINGEVIAHVQSSSTPAEVNITKYSVEGRNTLSITLDESSQVAEIEGWVDSATPSIGEVMVQSPPTIMVRDVAVMTQLVGEKLHSLITLDVKSHALAEKSTTIHYSLYGDGGELKSFGHKSVTLSMRGSQSLLLPVNLPLEDGWSADAPRLLTLKLRVQYEGRNVGYHSYRIGFREVKLDPESGELSINGTPQELKAKVISSNPSLQDLIGVKSEGYNTLRIGAEQANYKLYDMCDSLGIYVISPMPIDSSRSSTEITVGKNPSNDPQWLGAYLERVEAGFHTAQLHPSVIAFSLARNSANGYNLYESYLRLKAKGDNRAIIYLEVAGEWNSDKLKLTIE